MWHVWGRRVVHIDVLGWKPSGKNYLKVLGVDGSIILESTLKKRGTWAG